RALASWTRVVAQPRFVQFGPDGARVAIFGSDDRVVVQDLATGRKLVTLPGRPAGQWAWDLFSRDGPRLLIAHEDGSLRVWDASAGRALLTIPRYKYGVLSPDGTRVVAHNWLTPDRIGQVWDVTTGRLLAELREAGWRAVAFSADGSRLA